MQDTFRRQFPQDSFEEGEKELQPIIITIDENWIWSESAVKGEYIVCPVCYCIPIDAPIECLSCQRIFCQHDYEHIAHTTNRCPNCKIWPWVKKTTPHILYRKLFQEVRFVCVQCGKLNTPLCNLNSRELIEHMESVHSMFFSEQSILYDYSLVTEDGTIMKLNTFQNLQINYKRKMGLNKFEIAGIGGRIYSIDLMEMKTNHHLLGNCHILKERTESIKKGHNYYVWTARLNNIGESEQRFVFFSEDLQAVIQKNYREYERNQRLNEFNIDVRESRFRISFADMTQYNTYTKNLKPIERIVIKYKG